MSRYWKEDGSWWHSVQLDHDSWVPEPVVPTPDVLLDSNVEFFTVDEIAEAVRLTKVTVRRLLQSGELTGHKFGGEYRVRKQDLREFMERTRTTRKNRPDDTA